MVKFRKYSVLIPMLVSILCANAQAGLVLSVTDVNVTAGGGSFSIRAVSDGIPLDTFTAYSVNLLLNNYQGENLAGQSLNPVIATNVSPLELQLTPSPENIGVSPDSTAFNTSALTFVEFDPGAGTDLMTVTFSTPGLFTHNDSFDVTILPTTSVGLDGLPVPLTLPASPTTISGVPEPGTAFMMGVALAAVAIFGWRGSSTTRHRSSESDPAPERTTVALDPV